MYSVWAKRYTQEDLSNKMVAISFKNGSKLNGSNSRFIIEWYDENSKTYCYHQYTARTESFNLGSIKHYVKGNKINIGFTVDSSDFTAYISLEDYDAALVQKTQTAMGVFGDISLVEYSYKNKISNIENSISEEIDSQTVNNSGGYLYTFTGYTSEELCIYNDQYMDDSIKLQSPKLDFQENAAGSFSFKLPPTNVGYNLIDRLITEIIVRRDGKEIWSGRVLSCKEDFQKNKSLICEGELAYLNDTIQPQQAYNDMTLYAWLDTLLKVHNEKISSDKKFYMGYVDSSLNTTITEPYTNYENTLTAIANIINNYGGYLSFRKENGVRYIDYIAESNRPTSGQVIRFGKNLLDFTKSFDSTDFCTAILPLGERLENSYGISMSGIDGVDAYVTVESVNNGDPYVKSDDAVNEYGWICKKVDFDTNDEEELMDLAKEYLASTQFDTMVLEANAVDLSYLEIDAAKINLSEKVRVVSKPHGMDTYLKVSKISIPLDNPANTSFTMGSEIKTSLSAKSASANFDFNNYINNSLSDKSLVNIARTRAEYIANQHLTGYFTVTTDGTGSNEVYFTNQPIPDGYDQNDPLKGSNVSKYWRWNMGVLEYVNTADDTYVNGVKTHQPRLALTQEGEIVADRVSTGVLQDHYDGKHFYFNFNTGVVKMNVSELSIQGSAAATQTFASTTANNAATNAINNLSGTTIYNKLVNAGQGIYYSNGNFYINASYILSGTLTLGGYNNNNGVLNIKDSSSNTIGIWNNSGISIKKGSININDNFIVNESGILTAKGAIINGDITVGGSDNVNGHIYIQDRRGRTMYTIDNSGFYNSNVKVTSNEIHVGSAYISSDGSFYGNTNGEIAGGSLRIREISNIDGWTLKTGWHNDGYYVCGLLTG